MSEEIKVNRPVMADSEVVSRRSASKTPWIVLAVVVVVLVIFGVLFRDKLFGAKGAMQANGGTMSSSAYQAVFLTNGQVYFGKISNAQGDYATLKDIYYLQVVQQEPLQGTQAEGQAAGAAAQQPQISLVKLGNELHGPVDEMHISRAQILFYEDLKADGNVVKAIDAYKANPTK